MNAIRTIFSILAIAATVSALPVLQLDIDGGAYDWSTETIVTSQTEFELIALLSDEDKLGETFYISAALTPKVDLDQDLGSFAFDGKTIHATEDMAFGNPPIEDNVLHDGKDLAPHDIYDTYFAEFAFTFTADNTVAGYNTQPGEQYDGSDNIYYQRFTVDVSDLSPEYGLHFDLYNTNVRKGVDVDVDDFAPFSHDAEYVTVPEPAAVILLGLGMLGIGGLAMLRRRRA